MHHHHAAGSSTWLPLTLVVAVTAAYWLVAATQRSASKRWSNWRIAVFTTGSALLSLGLLPQYLPFPQDDFRSHMLQHLLLGMLAPIGWVMGAPVTLALRALPARGGRSLITLLHSRFMRFLTYPAVALILDLGGMAALYFTPLYMLMMMHPAVHVWVHFHFAAAGYLYTWVICGPDPGPRRPSVPLRLTILGVAVVIHSVLAQLLYSGAFVRVPAPLPQLQHGAELMYYGGDITEMLLAFALVSTWRPVRASPKRIPAGVDSRRTL
jgi:putative membrane protein